jgi:hypothetical protein
MTRQAHFAGLAAIALVAGCGDTIRPIGPELEGLGSAHGQGGSAVPDLSGEWIAAKEAFIHLDEFSAQLFGFQPEGTRTTIRCISSDGVMTLQQNGTSFAGTIAGDETVCSTSGGQTAAFPEAAQIVAGEIRGRSIQFTLLGVPGPVECPAHGVIGEVEGGFALELRGTWSCVEPGHPQSIWAAPPPRGGPNRTKWEAHRPQ